MGRATVGLASLLLAVTFLRVSAVAESLMAVQTDHPATKSGSILPVHCCKQEEEEAVDRPAKPVGGLADLASAEEQGHKPDSHRSNKKKIHDDDDADDDGDDDGDNDGSNDDDDDDYDDDGDGGDGNGRSDTDHNSDSDSGHDSHSEHDSDRDDDGDNLKSGKKKRSTPQKKGVPGGNR